ncbi:MAG: hypothetical protein IKQ88_02425 [Lachnospiraceae bacterium]|nr:hypothetical protein [Lachnospiraceae bacterium]
MLFKDGKKPVVLTAKKIEELSAMDASPEDIETELSGENKKTEDEELFKAVPDLEVEDEKEEEGADDYGDYERYVASELLVRYEHSKAYREGSSSRKVAVRADQLQEIEDELEEEEKKACFVSDVKKLKERGIADFSYDRDDENEIDRIWLIIDDDAIRKAYKAAGRRPKIDKITDFLKLINQAVAAMMPDSLYIKFLKDQRDLIEEKKDFTRYFSEDMKANAATLRFLLFLDSNEENKSEQMERVLSARLFKDSRYFEDKLRSKIISILYTIKKEYEEGGAEKKGGIALTAEEGDQLLAEKGIVRFPEIFEFTGEISVVLDEGRTADFSSFVYGACMNASMAERVDSVTFRNVKKIIFIQNKAVYAGYVAHRRKSDELVLYHGGFVSPAKNNWFAAIAEECARDGSIEVSFRGDIDAGGFRSFMKLKALFPTLIPSDMGVRALQANEKYVTELEEGRETDHIRELSDDPEYAVFASVMQYMLEKKIRLEQDDIPAE